jgi:CHAT domain-containing protein
VLAVGDPDYDVGRTAETAQQGAADGSVARGRMTLRRLPATGDEARAVGDVVLTRGAATESGFWAALAQRPRWRAVHIAAHGLADTGQELRSGIALTPSAQDDGLLSVLDVYRAGVNADLVVLSGCDTGMGRHLATDGYFGLSQAFLLAGAPRVLVSLWPVDDRATAALMTHFHASFRKGTPAARALREAQDAVRATPGWEHPSYWAAWVLWGLAE